MVFKIDTRSMLSEDPDWQVSDQLQWTVWQSALVKSNCWDVKSQMHRTHVPSSHEASCQKSKLRLTRMMDMACCFAAESHGGEKNGKTERNENLFSANILPWIILKIDLVGYERPWSEVSRSELSGFKLALVKILQLAEKRKKILNCSLV